MKPLLITLIATTMFIFSRAQNTVYGHDGSRHHFKKEKIQLIFKEGRNKVRLPDKEGKESAVLASLLPTAIDAVFKTTTKLLENHVKKFTAEYSKQSSNLHANVRIIPDLTFRRSVTLDNNKDSTALEIQFVAHPIDGQKLFYYAIHNIALHYSGALTSAKSRQFDYTIELKITFLDGKEKKTLELAPVTLTSIRFGNDNFDHDSTENRTELIPMPSGALLTDISVKITETNPIKVRAEKILAAWNDHKEDVKTVINNVFPETKGSGGSDSSGKPDGKGKDGKEPAKDPNESTGNTEAPKKAAH